MVEIPFLALADSLFSVSVKTAGDGLDPQFVEVLDPLGAPVPVGPFLTENPGTSFQIKKAPLPLNGAYLLRYSGAGGSTGGFSAKGSVKAPKVPKIVVIET